MKKAIAVLLMIVMVITLFPTYVFAEDALMTPGTYTGIGKGRHDYITVEVTVSENAIEDIKVVSYAETPHVGDAAVNKYPQSVLDNQSINVDYVSGATITSIGLRQAIVDCLTQAGGDEAVAAFSNRVELEKSTATETYDADVVVVGAGASGLTAATKANEGGAKVILVEKTGIVGGCSLFSFGRTNAWNTKIQLENDQEVNVDEKYNAWLLQKRWNVNPYLVRRWYNTNGETFNWLMDDWGLQYTPLTDDRIFLSSCMERNRVDTYDWMLGSLEDNGGEVMFYTTAKQLLTDESGAVTGIVAEREDGTTVVINAKAVILATGGYSADTAYLSEVTGITVENCCFVGDDGSGMRMAWEVGAKVPHNFGAQQYHQTGAMLNYSMDTYLMDYIPRVLGYINAIMNVDPTGRRFRDEAWSGNSNNIIANADTLSNIGGEFYCLYDQSMIDKLGETGYSALGIDFYLGIPDMPVTVNGQTPLEGIQEVMDFMCRTGYCYKGDTIEEVAEAAGMDPAVLRDTFTKYQSYCENGYDYDFLKTPNLLCPYSETGPYYLMKAWVITLGSVSSLLVNENMQVINTEDQPIPGLYSCGAEAFAAIMEGNYQGSGVGLGYAFTSGYMAGEEAAKFAVS